MKKILPVFEFILYWSIVMLPFSIAIAPGATYTFMGLMAFSFICKKLIKWEKPFVRTPVDLQLLLLVVVSILSFKNTVDYNASFQGITKLLQVFFLLLIGAEAVKDKSHLRLIIFSAACGACLASYDGYWQVNFGKDFIRGHLPIINIGITRATAAFPNANVLGVYLSAIAPLIIGLALFYYRGLKKVLMLLVAGLAAFGIVLTFSRGTALALYLSVLLICLVRKNKTLSALLIILLVIFPFIMPKSIKSWAKEVNYNPVRFMLNDRISVYKNTVNMIKHHPVVGVGTNTFSKNYLTYKLPEPEWARTTDSMYAHNHYLQMAGEIGLVGLAIFLWLLYRLFSENFRIYRRLKDDYLKVVSISLIACFFAFLVNGLTETSLYYSRVSMIFWYLIGVSFSLNKLSDQK
jgi:O-antigen ligase